MNVRFHQSPTIASGWWWEILPTEGELAPFGRRYASGYTFTLWGAKREARAVLRRLQEKSEDFYMSPGELLGEGR